MNAARTDSLADQVAREGTSVCWRLPPRIPQTEARTQCAYIAEAFFGRLLKRLGFPSPARRPPHIELVWMPFYVFDCGIRSRRGPDVMRVSVDGWSGMFALCELADALEEGRAAGEMFPPQLSAGGAAEIAQRELQYTIMRQRSQGVKPVVENAQFRMLIYLPFWAYYYERRRNLLDLVVLDAYSGAKTGPKVKAGLIKAFRKHTA